MKRDLSIEYIPLQEIKKWKRNPKSHDVGALHQSFARFGYVNPLIVNENNGELLAGHGRLETLEQRHANGEPPPPGIQSQNGTWLVPVVRGVTLPTEEAEAYAIADNRIGEIGGWSDADLADILKDMNLDGVGFDDDDVDRLLQDLEPEPQGEAPDAQVDKADELREKWQTERGQVWEVGRHRLMCGDANISIGVLLGGEKPDVLLTDPPYGIGIVKGLGTSDGAKPFGRVWQRGGKPAGVLGKVGGPGVVEPRLYHPIIGDDKPFEPVPLLGLAPTIIIFGAQHFASRMPDAPGWLVWNKGVSPESTFSACELVYCNKGNHVRMYDFRWSGMIRAGNREVEMTDRIHPTQKPVGLLEMIMADFSEAGQIILDPYMGSGSTLMAAERKGRICYGMEIDPAYVAVTLQRLADMGLEPRLL